MEIVPDPWLAGILSRDVFRLKDVGITAVSEMSDLARDHALGHPGGFYFAKVDSSDVSHVGGLEAVGYRVVDVNVTFGRSSQADLEVAGDSTVSVGDAEPSDHEGILDVAETCFQLSRFHLDPRISEVAANQVKREWVASYISGARGRQLIVARVAGRAAGFLAVLVADEAAGPVAVVDLIGVDRGHQRRGVGDALMRYFIDQWRSQAVQMAVGTQVANLSSIRLYTKLGFTLTSSHYVLHLHAARAL